MFYNILGPISYLLNVENKMGFTYKQGIGELIYTMVTDCPCIYFALMK